MNNWFIIFAISAAGVFTAFVAVYFFTGLFRLFTRGPSPKVEIIYFAIYEQGVWHVYYDSPDVVFPVHIASFDDIRDAEQMLDRVERNAPRRPGRVDEPAVKIDEPCEGRR